MGCEVAPKQGAPHFKSLGLLRRPSGINPLATDKSLHHRSIRSPQLQRLITGDLDPPNPKIPTAFTDPTKAIRD
jgi:hypothetical protein